MSPARTFLPLFLLALAAVACDPTPAAPAGPPQAARQAMARARELYAQDLPFEAVAEMRAAVEADPDWVEARLGLGKLLVTYSDVRFSTATIDRGRLDQAIEQFQRACALAPQNAEAAYWAGLALRKADRIPEAQERLEEAVRLRPDYGPAVKELALLYAGEGRTLDAIAAFQKARGLLPKDDEILFQLGLQLENEDRLEEARDAFLASAELNRAHPGPRSGLIRIYLRLGDEQASQHMQAEFDRCRAFGKELTQASLYYDEHNREPGACMGLAELYRKVGMPAQAVLWAERALRLDPEHAPARELLLQLGQVEATPEGTTGGER